MSKLEVANELLQEWWNSVPGAGSREERLAKKAMFRRYKRLHALAFPERRIR
jgi:hypothetical protein